MRFCPVDERLINNSIPVPESGCWLWERSVYANKYNYGKIRVKRKTLLAHRVSYETFKGEIPKGMHVLHKCDTYSCVNPEHLFLGDDKDNMIDASKKGRLQKKLALTDTAEIIDLNRYGFYQYEIAKMYGVSKQLINIIIKSEEVRDERIQVTNKLFAKG